MNHAHLTRELLLQYLQEHPVLRLPSLFIPFLIIKSPDFVLIYHLVIYLFYFDDYQSLMSNFVSSRTSPFRFCLRVPLSPSLTFSYILNSYFYFRIQSPSDNVTDGVAQESSPWLSVPLDLDPRHPLYFLVDLHWRP